MPSVSIRRLIGIIGLVVALATATAIPVGYAVTGYFHESAALGFKARLNAGRVAKYVYAQGSLWRFHRVRLAELIEIEEANEQDRVRQRIYAAPERLVLDDQFVLAWPTFARSAPIVVSGTQVGRIEVEASARPLIVRTGIVAIFGLALAGLSFFLLCRFPLRILDRTMAALERRDEELQAQNYRFETALDNMVQGLCMFDAQKRLVVCNRQYATMYALPAEYAKPGTELRRIIEHRQAHGLWPTELSTDTTNRLLAILPKPESSWYETVDLPDGRVIALSCRHMKGGGWIAVHDDITERTRAEAARLRPRRRPSSCASRSAQRRWPTAPRRPSSPR